MMLFSISDSVQHAFTVFFAWLPRLAGALLVLLIGYFVAKLVAKLLSRLLQGAGLDRTLHSGQGGNFVQRVTDSPSALLGQIAFWAIFLGAISLAASVLGIAALTGFVAAIWAYIPNVIAAFAIFLVAGAISAGVAGFVGRTMGETPLGKIVATAVPVVIMSIAVFMILEQLKIATQIVTITYAAIWGAIALGSALAFGLGGRDVAARMLEGAYQSGQRNKEQFKRDLDTGMHRASNEVDRMKEQAQSGNAGGATAASH
jgi:Mechanosensitive ion channel, conserved TM helix